MKPSYDLSQGKRGVVIPATGKTRITMYLDDDVLEAFRAKASAEGKGYQTMINDVLRKAMVTADSTPVTVEVLRQVIREELHAH
ncbi:MAG: BrnA antitoxin family protein [Burkholderiales bacterium]